MFILILQNLCSNLVAKPYTSYMTCSVTKYIRPAEHTRLSPNLLEQRIERQSNLMPTQRQPNVKTLLYPGTCQLPISNPWHIPLCFSFSGPTQVRGINSFGHRTSFSPNGCWLTLTPMCYVRSLRDIVYRSDWRIPMRYTERST